MKFIVDAQLPYGITFLLKNMGHEAVHTDDLPNKERTSDTELRELSIKEQGIIITKDTDFLDSYYIQGIPSKLLLITTGNINNKELYKLLNKNLVAAIEMFDKYSFIELDNFDIIAHE